MVRQECTVENGHCMTRNGDCNMGNGKCTMINDNGLAMVSPIDISDMSSDAVGIDGVWYDVTHFKKIHPGGPIMNQYIGKDATTVFRAFNHDVSFLNRVKKIGTYKVAQHPCDVDFEKLRQYFMERGFFETDYLWYVIKACVAMSWYAASITAVLAFDNFYVHMFGAVLLAFFIQQSGFIMHDSMHKTVSRDHIKDQFIGTFFGTVGFGMSSHWWHDEHIIHHIVTNAIDVTTKFVDPQMWELSWAQNEKLFPLFSGVFQYLFIKIQHITFVPFVVAIGRYEIITDSYRVERRWYEWLAIVLHWTWMIALLSQLPSWRERAIFYVILACVEGLFHFQLILSHYCKAFITMDEFHQVSWNAFQVLSNMNLETYKFMDWYYGGLNFHIEHHLYPKMARKHLRTAGPYVKAVCEKHGIDYDMLSFVDALKKTLSHMKKVGDAYKYRSS